MDDYMNLSREEVHAFLEKSLESLESLEELRGEHAGDEETIGEIDHGIACLRYLQEIMGMLDMIMEMPLSAAVPVSELLKLRDELYENDQITMLGLEKLNRLIAKGPGGTEEEHGSV